MSFNRRTALGLLAGVLLISTGPALADEPAFLTAKDVNLLDLLPAPPDAEKTKAEIAAFHAFEATRTEEQAKHGVADDEETVFRFLAGMGIDALHKGRTTIYSKPAAVSLAVSPSGKGARAQLAIRW